MLFHPRHMRITKNRNAIRIKRRSLADIFLQMGKGLVRQAINQIDIDIVDTGVAHKGKGLLHLIQRLHAANRPLHIGIEVLKAKADPIDADFSHNGHKFSGEHPRVKLHRVMRQVSEVKARGKGRPEPTQIRRSQSRRRAAAPMHIGHTMRGAGGADMFQFLNQMVGI